MQRAAALDVVHQNRRDVVGAGARKTAVPGTREQSERSIEGRAALEASGMRLEYRSIRAVRPRLQISMPAIRAAPMSIGT